MRTRATGQSPGGFHVLASPKRVRRQPPAVRTSRASAVAPESSSEEVSETGNESASALTQAGFHFNRDASNHQAVSRPNTTHKKLAPITRKQSLSTEPRSLSAMPGNLTRNDSTRIAKNTGVKRRAASVKKTQSNRRSNKPPDNSKLLDIESEGAVETQAVPNNRRKSSSNHLIESTLGKRNRSASMNFYDASKKNVAFCTPKRLRIYDGEEKQQTIATVDLPPIIPPDCSEKDMLDTSQTRAFNARTSLQSDQKSNGKEKNNMKSSELSVLVPNRQPGSPKLNSDTTDIVETHLRRGIQSIMSRMNKYNYQPLPKNPYDSTIAVTPAQKTAVPVAKETMNGLKKVDEAPVEPRLNIEDKEISPQELHQKETAVDFEKKEFEGITKEQNASNREQKSSEKIQNASIIEKARQIEAEKLFRSAAPNAAYQSTVKAPIFFRQSHEDYLKKLVQSEYLRGLFINPSSKFPSIILPVPQTSCICFYETSDKKNLMLTDPAIIDILRAVAEWAMRDTSNLPTRDEIIAFLESPKAKDTQKLSSPVIDSSSPNNAENLSRRKKIVPSNVLLNTEKIQVTENCKQGEKNHARNEILSSSVTPNSVAPPHVVISASDKTQKVSSNAEPSATLDQQLLKPPVIPRWGFINTVKSIVTSPLKALGLGFVDNQETVDKITKDIKFAYNPPVTPTPSERRKTKFDCATSQRRARRQMAIVDANRIQTGPQTDRPLRFKSLDNRAPSRRIVTEKRKVELLRQQNLKKSQARLIDEIDDSNRRRKKPTKNLELSNRVPASSHTPSDHQNLASNKRMEEWPPKLDPNRPVVDFAQAADFLPRGPNGEDVATMLCKGWLISKHHDSFIRETGDPKIVASTPRKVVVKPPELSPDTQIQKPNSPGLSKSSPKDSSKEEISKSQPGRSYGFSYDDDSSSEDEKVPSKTESVLSSLNAPNSEQANGLELIEASQASSIECKMKATDFSGDDTNPTGSDQSSANVVQRLRPPLGTPYTPRMPSSLRHVEALSPYPSNLTPMSTQSSVLAPSADNTSSALVKVDILPSPSQRMENDWSSMYCMDPNMAHFDLEIIAAVEALPDDVFPLVELPLPYSQDEEEFVY